MTIDYILGGFTALLLVIASPLIYEQATSEPSRVDADYWEERGYPPLPQKEIEPTQQEQRYEQGYSQCEQ